jgi:co-chaperonin GroES (HSP10)
MSKLKIKPWGNKIQLDFPTTKAGALQVDTGASIQEIGVVLAIGPEVHTLRQVEKNKPVISTRIKVGDRLLIKTWDVDIITLENEVYYFISEDSRAICGIVK